MIDLYLKHTPFLTNEMAESMLVVQHVWAVELLLGNKETDMRILLLLSLLA